MPLYIVIAAAVTAAVTAKLMQLVFLSGRTLTNATMFGRLVAGIEPARRAFVAGWRTRGWRYQCVVWPCMLISTALVTLLLRWMMPALDNAQTLSDKIRYSLLVFGVGASASIGLALALVLAVYYLGSLLRRKWAGTGEKEDGAPAEEPAGGGGGAGEAE